MAARAPHKESTIVEIDVKMRREVTFLEATRVVLAKDLRIELRSRVALWQVLPFALLMLVLFAFALGPGPVALRQAAPGLFWLAVLFSTVLAVQRSYAIEAGEGTRDGLRLWGMDPAGIFLGKAGAVAVQLAVLQGVLWVGVTVLFGARVRAPWLAVAASVLATVGLASAGVLYGAMSQRLRVRETLLPMLVLPIVAPVLVAGARAWEGAMGGSVADGVGWLRTLGPFAVVYLVVGIVLYGPLQEAA
jgi:heme exporter protein B